MAKNIIVKLNEVVEYHLLKFLDGIDVTNFIEAVNGSEQFGLIAKTCDVHFYYKLVSVYNKVRRIFLPRESFQYFTEEMEIDEEQLVLIPTRYSSVTQPSERLYIHPSFTQEGFSMLCELYNTPFFKCYCRLLPLNTVSYYANFGLLDYECYRGSLGLKRGLNQHEKKLFKGNISKMSCRTSSIVRNY